MGIFFCLYDGIYVNAKLFKVKLIIRFKVVPTIYLL
jgi:hypothetical protein